jgi:hypothetical protein
MESNINFELFRELAFNADSHRGIRLLIQQKLDWSAANKQIRVNEEDQCLQYFEWSNIDFELFRELAFNADSHRHKTAYPAKIGLECCE